MIVTCERCSARYKLDDSKIKGRGARITCPKCQHVFVVYNKAAEQAPAGGEPADPDPEQDSGDEAPVPSSDNPLAQDPTSDTGLVGGGPSADALDFRKVGISTWKVKVKIGLVYDFSDIGTLRKYIQDRRVTEDDVISHDGSEWVRIGDIPDLDAYFIQVYEELEDQLSGGGDEEQATGEEFEDDGPTMVVGMGSLRSNISTGVFQRPVKGADAAKAKPLQDKPPANGGGGPAAGNNRFVDPFESLKERQRDRMRAKRRADGAVSTGAHRKGKGKGKGKGGDKRAVNPWLIAAGVAGLAVVGWYFFLRTPPKPVVEVAVAPPPPENTLADSVAERAREQILGKLEGELVQAGEEKQPIDEGSTDDLLPTALSPDDIRKLCDQGKLPPDRCRNLGSSSGDPGTGPGRTVTRPSDGGYQATSPQQHAANGAAAAQRGDWTNAAIAYGEAVKASPSTAAYRQGLALAYYNKGELDNAQQQFEALAGAGDVSANLYLGRILAKLGDPFGAGAMYDKYLAANPNDSKAKAERDAL